MHFSNNAFDTQPPLQDALPLLKNGSELGAVKLGRNSMPHQAYGRAQYSSWYNFRRGTNLLWTSHAAPGQNILSVHETLPITAKTSQGSMEHKPKQRREFGGGDWDCTVRMYSTEPAIILGPRPGQVNAYQPEVGQKNSDNN